VSRTFSAWAGEALAIYLLRKADAKYSFYLSGRPMEGKKPDSLAILEVFLWRRTTIRLAADG
jgi:hypothetical protein